MGLVKETNFYRYIVSEFNILFTDGSVIKLTHGEILNINIEKDFDTCYFPLLNVKLLLDYDVYYKILENKTTVRFKFKFNKYIADKQALNNGNGKNNFLEKLFDTTFGIYIDDDTSSMDKELYEKTKNAIGQQNTKKTYDFYLFKDEDLKSGKYTSNYVLSRCNMTDALVFLFSKAGMKNILMSPLDNNKVYSEVLIPYIPLTQTINFLEQHYGFYKGGAMLFYDFDTTYFISKFGKRVYRTGEFNSVTMTFFKPGTSASLSPGCYKDKTAKKLIVHVSQDNMMPLNESIIQEQTGGTNLAIINASSDDVANVSPDVNTRSGKTTKVIVNKFENPYLETMSMLKKIENDRIIDVNLYDVDLSFLTPNKIFTFSFDEKASQKKYGGTYRLTKLVTSFSKQGTDFSATVQARFKITPSKL